MNNYGGPWPLSTGCGRSKPWEGLQVHANENPGSGLNAQVLWHETTRALAWALGWTPYIDGNSYFYWLSNLWPCLYVNSADSVEWPKNTYSECIRNNVVSWLLVRLLTCHSEGLPNSAVRKEVGGQPISSCRDHQQPGNIWLTDFTCGKFGVNPVYNHWLKVCMT